MLQIAMKIIYKDKLSLKHWTKFMKRELDLLQVISHPNVIELLQIVETERHCFMSLEMAENGDLLNYLNVRGTLPEDEARFIFNQMCQGILYCHSFNISHRDLKLENIFFTNNMDVKIGGKSPVKDELYILLQQDLVIIIRPKFNFLYAYCLGFHFALSLMNHLSATPCGSYSYAAPEVVLSKGEKYDTQKADCWSL